MLDSLWVSLMGLFEALEKAIIGKLSLSSKRKKWRNLLGKHIQTVTGDVRNNTVNDLINAGGVY